MLTHFMQSNLNRIKAFDLKLQWRLPILANVTYQNNTDRPQQNCEKEVKSCEKTEKSPNWR